MGSDSFIEFAPAKINLFLHIVDRQKNGYHLLESLVAFTKSIGDIVSVEKSYSFSLKIKGKYGNELSDFPIDNNLVSKAVFNLSKAVGKAPNVYVILNKNLPLASGIGGGSADAAAVLRAMIKFWELDLSAEKLNEIALNLGADVPTCLTSQAGMLTNTATFSPLKNDDFPAMFLVLVNPQIPLSTPAVFKEYKPPFSPSISPFLKVTNWDIILESKNDLTSAAIKIAPEISVVLSEINKTKNCFISRMSGSGATCFGIYKNKIDAQNAAQNIQTKYPNWWVADSQLIK